jgi:hypothetical protein
VHVGGVRVPTHSEPAPNRDVAQRALDQKVRAAFQTQPLNNDTRRR